VRSSNEPRRSLSRSSGQPCILLAEFAGSA